MHLSVCIPTFKRPHLLGRCLDAIARQEGVPFAYSVVVVDNDPAQSARPIVQEYVVRLPMRIAYFHQPNQNISLARNSAVTNAEGEFIAFIDDDECAEPAWLRTLCESMGRFKADGVLGPVLPQYVGCPPDWLIKSGLCDRPSFRTGTRISESKYLRAGNILLRRSAFQCTDTLFDPRLGRSGGEDAELFSRMAARGAVFVWCAEARVHEVVPIERQTLAYHLKRALIRGVTEADLQPLLGLGTLKSSVAVVLYALALPVLFAVRRHLFARYLVRWCDHGAKLLAHLGVRVVSERLF